MLFHRAGIGGLDDSGLVLFRKIRWKDNVESYFLHHVRCVVTKNRLNNAHVIGGNRT